MGLAEPVAGGRFVLATGLAETLTEMGERDDIIRTMQREFSARAIDRNLSDQIVYQPRSDDARLLVGRVLARGLSDEHADRHYLIVEALDGRAHYVDIGAGAGAEAVGEQAIVQIEPLKPAVRAPDRTVAAIAAANGGRYDIDAHLRHDPAATEGFAETHVRRLEAMRRAGVPLMRSAAGEWTIGDDHLAHVERYEAARLRDRPVAVSMASPVGLDVMERSYAATWLDRELTSETPSALRDAGFGGDVRAALDRRRRWLLAQGFAEEVAGQTTYPPDMLARLRQREIRAVASSLAVEMGKPFSEALEGGRVSGVVRQTLDLKSGRFTVIERAHDFTLVPWRPTLERASGLTVSGIMRETGTSWTIGRGRQGPVIG